MNKLNNEISKLKEEISKENEKIDFNDIQGLVELGNEKLIRVVSIEANIEELILIVKKAYEKKVIELEEMTKFIRSLSRELFKMKTYRNKLQNS